MKILLLLLLPCFALSQTLKENRVDEFTGKSIKRTSYEKLTSSFGGGLNVFAAMERIDSSYRISLKIWYGNKNVFAVKDQADLMFKMSNGDVVKLPSTEYVIASRGAAGGANAISGSSYGATVSYRISSDEMKNLSEGQIEKARIYFTEGYEEFEIKDKADEKIKALIDLIK